MNIEDIQESTTSPPGFPAAQTSEGARSPLRSVFRGKWMAWIVLLASLVVTYFAWYLARGSVLESANERFVLRSQVIELALRDRLHANAFLLQSGAGLFAGSEQVTRAEWRSYVTALQIDKHYQGVQGLGFSKRILAAEKKSHIRQMRAEGFPNYKIQPDGERPEYTSIIFLEPFDWRNQRAFGYDMFSEATRRAAMEMARDSGSAALSGRVTLLQETENDVQAGFLMYLPVYRKGQVVETPEQRRDALVGYVYSPIRMNDFMQGLLIEKREDVEIQVFDADEPLKETLLYPSGNLQSLISHSGHVHFATYQSTLEYAGRRWLLDFTSSPYFEATIDTAQVNRILLPGIIISLLLFAVVLSLTRSRNQALSLANMSLELEKANVGLRREIEERKQGEEKIRTLNDELEEKVLARTQQLGESQDLLSTVFDSVLDGIVLVDLETRQFRMSNTSFQRMLRYSADEILELGVEDIHPQQEMDNVNRQIERQIKQEYNLASNIPVKRKDGSIFYADINTRVMIVKQTSFLLAVFTDITERRQAILALQESEEKFHAMSASAQDAIIMIDQTGNISFWNAAAEKILGYSSQEVLGKNLHNLIAPERYLEAHRKSFEYFQQTGEGDVVGKTLELIALHRDGSEFPVELSLSAVSIGNQWHALGIIRDITERKQAEQTLSQSEHFLDTLLNAIPVPVFYKDSEGRYLGFNKAYETFFGATRDQLIGKSVFDISPPELAKIYHAKDTELFESGEMQQYESQVKNTQGILRNVIFNKAVFTDSQGVVSGLIGAILDITERKQAEEKILTLNQTLKENVQQLLATQEELEHNRAHLEQKVVQRTVSLTEAQRIAHLGNWDWDLINNTVNWSDEMYRIFGYTPQQIVVSYEVFLNAVHPEDRQRVADSVRDALERLHTLSIEHCIIQPDGTIRYVHGQTEIFRGEDGKPISMLGTYHDITERKLAEQAAIDERNFSNTLIASQPDIFYVLDPSGQFVRWNDKLRDLLGYSESQMAAANAQDIIHEADRPSVAQQTRETFEQGSSSNVARLITKTGIRDFSLTAMRVDTAKGEYAVGVGTDITERKRAEAEVQKLQEQLREQALRDPLTGLYNRRYLNETIERELARAARNKQPVGIVMCDLDQFKLVNDTHGHLAGDKVLRVFTELLKKHARGSDIVCRFGGEEFVIFLPGMSSAVAYQRAEQLCAELAAKRITLGAAVIQMTASFGVAAFPENGKTMDSLIGAVDTAMYQAKEAGRNRVVISSVRAAESSTRNPEP